MLRVCKQGIVCLSMALICAMTIACGGGDKKVEDPGAGLSSNPQPTSKVESDDFGAKVTAYAKEMIKLIEANKGDCSALGERLNSYFSENKAFFEKMIKTGSSIEAKSWKDDHQDLVAQLNGSMKVITGRCRKDSGVAEFVKSMNDLAK